MEFSRQGKLGAAGLIALFGMTAFAMGQGAPAPAAGAAPANPPAPPARAPEMALSVEMAQAAVAACAANGYKVGVSIVDAAGVLRVMVSADGASKQGSESSTRKAYTAALLKTSTADTQAKVATDKALADKIAADPMLFARAGGLPLMVGNDLIGAIGVGGAPGGERDEACAVTAVDKVKARLK
ncbi:MAG: heme-binding protein [Bauldia sp.]